MSRRTANTTVATPKYCCLFCFQKHGTIKQTWGGYVVKQVARRSTQYVHKCIGLTRHLRQSNECSAYYSSHGLTWNRHINYKSSMLSGPIIHQQVHQPAAFGLTAAGNTQSNRTTSSNPQSQHIQRVVPNMLQAPIDRSVIHNYLREQSLTAESHSNNNNPSPNDTNVNSDNNDTNDLPMQFDTVEDRPPQPNISSTHLNNLEKKRKSIPVRTPSPGLFTEIELMDILNQHRCPQIVRKKSHNGYQKFTPPDLASIFRNLNTENQKSS